jgi:hypothetical protein
MRLQQPSRQASFQRMYGITGGTLLDLGQQVPLVTMRVTNCLALARGFLKLLGRNDDGISWQLNDRTAESIPRAQPGKAPMKSRGRI